jgi:outer membrane lipoprotein-sorting protein
MDVRTSFLRHRSLRWIVPVAVVGGMSMAAAGMFSAQASTNLPRRTAAQLLADVENARINGLSGTIVSKADLGLPRLPEFGGSSASGGTLMDLLSGSHTARVWYAGPTKQRVALLDAVGETDVFHDGKDVWEWSSADKLYSHTTLRDGGEDLLEHPPTTLTPDQLADRALAAITPSTVVTTDENRRVADRAAYELVLRPRDRTSRVGSVHIAIDGKMKIPVSVQVFARGNTSSPALDVSFTRLSFKKPSDSQFSFTPPSGAIQAQPGSSGAGPRYAPSSPKLPSSPQAPSIPTVPSTPDVRNAGSGVTTIGTGWTTVVEVKVGDLPAVGLAQQTGGLKKVAGGYLFDSKLLTAYLTDDGRLFAGAVDPPVLYAAAK